MKRKKLLLATLLLPAVCHAQSVVEYTYDDAGNRLSQLYPLGRICNPTASNISICNA